MASSSSTTSGARADRVHVAVALADDRHLGVAAGGELARRGLGGEQDGKLLDLHGDQIGGVLGGVGIAREDRRHRLTDVAHPLAARAQAGGRAPAPEMRPSRKSMGGSSEISAAVHTATTPGPARAAAVSMERMLPCAWFERTTRMCSWCGKEISPAKRPRPVTSGGSSSRSTDWPIHLLPRSFREPRARARGASWRRRGRAGTRRSCWRPSSGSTACGSRIGRGLEGGAAGRSCRERGLGLGDAARLRLGAADRHARLGMSAALDADRSPAPWRARNRRRGG